MISLPVGLVTTLLLAGQPGQCSQVLPEGQTPFGHCSQAGHPSTATFAAGHFSQAEAELAFTAGHFSQAEAALTFTAGHFSQAEAALAFAAGHFSQPGPSAADLSTAAFAWALD